MLRAVHMLNVHKIQVEIRQIARNYRKIGEPGRFHSRIYAPFLGCFKKSDGKIGLGERFSAGERNPPARTSVIYSVPFDDIDYFADGDVLPDDFFLAAERHFFNVIMLTFGVTAPFATERTTF